MTEVSLIPASQPAPFSVTSALDARVRAEFEEREPDGYWHPSSLFGCLRQAIYASRGAEVTDERDVRSKRILRVGHQFHEYIQGAVNADPRVLAAFDEVKIVDEGRKIKGSLDHFVVMWTGSLEEMPRVEPGYFVRYPEPLWEWVRQGLARVEILEYKTISDYAFKYKDLPKADHVGQLSVYLSVLGVMGGVAGDGTVIPPMEARGRIAYVSKNDLLIEEYTVLLTQGKERQILERVAYLDSYAADGTALPPRLPDEVKKGKTTRAFLCGYCPYQQRCWEVDGPGVDLTGGSGAQQDN